MVGQREECLKLNRSEFFCGGFGFVFLQCFPFWLKSNGFKPLRSSAVASLASSKRGRTTCDARSTLALGMEAAHWMRWS